MYELFALFMLLPELQAINEDIGIIGIIILAGIDMMLLMENHLIQQLSFLQKEMNRFIFEYVIVLQLVQMMKVIVVTLRLL